MFLPLHLYKSQGPVVRCMDIGSMSSPVGRSSDTKLTSQTHKVPPIMFGGVEGNSPDACTAHTFVFCSFCFFSWFELLYNILIWQTLVWRYQRYFAPSCIKEYLHAERQLSGHCYGPFLADRALLHPKRIHLVMSLNFVKSCDAFLIVTEKLAHGRPSNYSLQYVASPGDPDSVKAIQRSQHGLLLLHWYLLGSGFPRPAHL